MPYRFEVPRPFKDSEQEYLEFDDNVPIDEAISASDKYYTKQFFNGGLHMALGALIKERINSEDFISGMGDKLGDFMETLNLAVKGQNKYTDPTSEYFNTSSICSATTSYNSQLDSAIFVLPKLARSLNPGCAPMATLFFTQFSMVRLMVSESPA